VRVLVGCEYSGVVREEFASRGHDAWSCDLLETEEPGQHFQCDVLDVLDQGWDLAIFHPDCTYLTNSGVHHLYRPNQEEPVAKGVPRWKRLHSAAMFFNKLKDCEIPKICIENPIPHCYAKNMIGKYTQLIQPWQHGHSETKATCLWLKGLPNLPETNNVKSEMMKLPKKERSRVHYASPKADRWKDRSRTLPGIAKAMADTWG